MYAYVSGAPKVAVRVPGSRVNQFAESRGLEVHVDPAEPAAAFIGPARHGQIGDEVIGFALPEPFPGSFDTHNTWLENVRGMQAVETAIGATAAQHAA